MDKNEGTESLQPHVDESEYKMPESGFKISKPETSFSWQLVIVVIFLLILLCGLGVYLYWGMKHIPEVVPETYQPSQDEHTEVTDDVSSTLSPEIVARMEAMQRESTTTSEERARMEAMQQTAVQATDQAVLDRMEAMNPGVVLPNP